jgi:hypothetical protein
MSIIILSFVIGAVIGATIGILVAGLCQAAGKDDRARDNDYHECDY